MRTGELKRITGETQIEMGLRLEGEGIYSGSSCIGFMDHMLTLFCKHGGIDVDLKCSGDLWVDTHHLVEDLGIVLGAVLRQAIGNAAGIRRYGSCTLPMDEVLTSVNLDFSGRGYLVFNAEFSREKVGDFETEMLREFMYALAINAGMNLHINVHYGLNDHHKIESIFKALARAIKDAVCIVDETGAIPSTKGVL